MKRIYISTVIGMKPVMADVFGPVAVHGEIVSLNDGNPIFSTEKFVIVHIASGGRLTSWTTFSLTSAQWAAEELSKVGGWECMDCFIGADPTEQHKATRIVPAEFTAAIQSILTAATRMDEEMEAAS